MSQRTQSLLNRFRSWEGKKRGTLTTIKYRTWYRHHRLEFFDADENKCAEITAYTTKKGRVSMFQLFNFLNGKCIQVWGTRVGLGKLSFYLQEEFSE